MKAMTKKQTLAYQQRWKRIELVQTRELQTTPVSLKFKQLCLLMDFFRFREIDKKSEKDINEIRKRWSALKRKWGHGGH